MNPKDILTNPAFCPMPWTGLMYNFDGTVRNCIRSTGTLGNIKNDSIENILHNNTNVSRQALIIDKKIATTTGANINPVAIASPYKNISSII